MAINDWDSAGWFPEYLEYTKAMFTLRTGRLDREYRGDDEQLAGECQLYEVCRNVLT